MSRLGGLSNANFKVETKAGSFVVRLLRPDKAGVVDRHVEIEAMRLAEQLGIGVELLHADLDACLMITRFEAGAEPLSVERLRDEPTSLDQAVATLRRFHRFGRTLSRRFDAFAALDRQAGAFADAGRPLPWSAPLTAAVARLCDALARSSARPLPIHGDPVPENFLKVAGGMKLIDWEYAGMGDPAWDLAYLVVEAGLGDAGKIIAAYGDSAPTPDRLAGFRLLAATLSGGWRLLGGGELQPGGAERLAQAEAMAASPDLPRWIAALQN